MLYRGVWIVCWLKFRCSGSRRSITSKNGIKYYEHSWCSLMMIVVMVVASTRKKEDDGWMGNVKNATEVSKVGLTNETSSEPTGGSFVGRSVCGWHVPFLTEERALLPSNLCTVSLSRPVSLPSFSLLVWPSFRRPRRNVVVVAVCASVRQPSNFRFPTTATTKTTRRTFPF